VFTKFNENQTVEEPRAVSLSNGVIGTVRTDAAVVMVPSEMMDVFVAAFG
jgi:hypothetical protein